MIQNALTIDVEDYFQVNAFARYIRYDQWDTYPLRVEDNTRRILNLLEEFDIHATFFVLGWIAERVPSLVREIRDKGHELGCHGYGHQLIYKIGPEAFRKDIRLAKQILEDISEQRVTVYRAPSYSITRKSLWALDILAEEGFTVDSSIFPVLHDTYGISDAPRFPHVIKRQSGSIIEFPLTTYPLNLGFTRYSLPIAGGGYLRLFPVELIRMAIDRINRIEKRPAILYFHPWELDPEQPRIKAGVKSTFRHYVNLRRTEKKLRYLFDRHPFGSLKEALEVVKGTGSPEEKAEDAMMEYRYE